MTHEQFRTYLLESQPTFKAWGDRVVSEINLELKRQLGERYSSFLKISPEPRLKKVGSAIGKLIHKGYSKPAESMTDLVGARFVVLLSNDIDIISGIIEGSDLWTASLDKDYLDEIEKKPHYFNYQSKHYVLRANGNIQHDGLVIPDGTACEIQIRTILQHAYAEIVHDNIYKPSGIVPPKAERLVARSMALMETTDDLFCKTIEELKVANSVRNTTYAFLNDFYTSVLNLDDSDTDIDFNYSILDTYRHLISDETIELLTSFINTKKYIPQRIQENAERLFLFKQPVVILIYYLVSISDHEVKSNWQFESLNDDLGTIYSDLGIAQGSVIY